MKSAQIREKFLNFFEKKKHTRLPSSSLIPAEDPTLFFANAGMVPFKNVFLGTEKKSYKRAATSQKCMRVSGKHNDLENVGYTPRHHTFFEMLGNFSFGDYFKKEAIALAWEFLTKEIGIPKEKLYITVFEDDDEAAKLWQKHVLPDRIFRLGEKDNFWSMGKTGPCGPCSEIHYDWGSGPVSIQDFESDRLFEIWNLVFMQFNRNESGKMENLAKPSIDTGMGLERLSCILQNKKSNYETDLFEPIIQKISSITDCGYGTSAENDVALQVLADHIRGATFLIADGLIPSNEGRGYVLRRILRRAIRYGRQLEMSQPFFSQVADVVIEQMGQAYPELVQNRGAILKTLQIEEEQFLETIERGLSILNEEIKNLGKKNVIPGEVVFKLYDTFGFPKDLTGLIAREQNLKIDDEGFESCMNRQKERARASWKGSGAVKADPAYEAIYNQGVRTKFIGYEKEEGVGEVLALIQDGKKIKEISEGNFYCITSQTPFYAESGGQVGDSGVASSKKSQLSIQDTQKLFGDLYVHAGKLEEGSVSLGGELVLKVDHQRRSSIERNHTATHLVHAALREVLGDHVKQAGSLVDETKLRFDFSHSNPIAKKQLDQIELRVNQIIRENLAVSTKVISYQEALSRGALAFFGEKYGEVVRMVSVPDFSIELCGGTHCKATGEIGLFKFISETGVASGVRRIEAVTGKGAQDYVDQMERWLSDISEKLKSAPKNAVFKVEKLIQRVRKLEKDLASLKKEEFSENLEELLKEKKEINGVVLLASKVSADSPQMLREIADRIKQKIKSGIIILGAKIDEKAALVIIVTKDFAGKFHAGKIMQQLAPILGGKGGGRPDMAQGGGPDYTKLDQALSQIEKNLST